MNSNIDRDSTALFLYDLNVVLDYDYAEPNRELFQELVPHFAQHSELPLANRIVAAYADLKSVGEIGKRSLHFRGIVTAALIRSASVALGKYRTLIVLDIAKQICPEILSDSLWRSLLFRQMEDEMPSWLNSLAFRWTQWQINIGFTKFELKRALKLVEPRGFEHLVTWALEQSCPDEPSRERFVAWLLNLVHSRIAEDTAHFQIEEVDIIQCLDRIEEAAVPFLEQRIARNGQGWEQRRQDALKLELQTQIKGRGGDPDFRPTDTGDDFEEIWEATE